MALLCLPLSGLIITAPELTRSAAMVCGLILVVMIVLLFVGVANRRRMSNILHVEVGYIAAFQILILAAAYMR